MKGYARVQSFENGKAALEAIQKDDIKLVLLDVMLPDTNGVDVLRKIKAAKNDVAVIMITGFPDEEKAKEAIKEGAYDYIIKPFDLNYLELSVLTKIFLMR
jgi:DNA-binding NtrC family response regulator